MSDHLNELRRAFDYTKQRVMSYRPAPGDDPEDQELVKKMSAEIHQVEQVLREREECTGAKSAPRARCKPLTTAARATGVLCCSAL